MPKLSSGPNSTENKSKKAGDQGQRVHLEKDQVFDLGTLLLQLPELYKLGMRALHASTLVHQTAELACTCYNNPEELAFLSDHCRSYGLDNIEASETVALMIEQCLREIAALLQTAQKPLSDDVVEAVKSSETFLASLNSVTGVARNSVSKLPAESDSEVLLPPSNRFSEIAILIIETSIAQGNLLTHEIASFKSLRGSIHTWIDQANVTTHAGGYLRLYWPPEPKQ